MEGSQQAVKESKGEETACPLCRVLSNAAVTVVAITDPS